jgi:hypothetical protein
MTPHPEGSRRFTDEEVQQLLKRAAELESQGTTVPAKVDGPTLSELEAIAEEAGMSPASIRRAAQELGGTRGGVPDVGHRGSGFLGAPLHLELERSVKGEVTPEALEGLVPMLQRVAEGMGHPSLMGRTLTWQSEDSSKTRVLNVSVRALRGDTQIVISERYGNLAGGLFGGIMGGVGGGVGFGVGFGVGLGALGSALFATVFPIAAVTGSYLIARTAFKGTVQGRVRVLNRLMEDLVMAVEDGVEEGSRRLEEGS